MLAARLTQTRGTLNHLAASRAQGLTRALGLEHRSDEFEQLCLKMMHPWGQRSAADSPDYLSRVVDDGTPFEFSIALDQVSELRFMVEPLGMEPSLSTNAEAAGQLLGALSHDYDLDLSRFSAIADLFLPEQPQGGFLIWIAAAIRAEGPPQFKLYLNPAARGPREAPRVIEESLYRLGIEEAWPAIGNVLTWRGPEADELKYFSLDLSASTHARVKVYARHHRSTRDIVTAAASACSSYDPDVIHSFLRTVAPNVDVYDGRGPFTCYAFVGSSASAPDSVATHFPINGYVESDQEAHERILRTFDVFDLPNAPYLQALAAVVDHPLSERLGTHSYISLRRHRGQTRLTAYLPCEAYAPGTVENPKETRRASGVSERASATPGAEPRKHPLFKRLQREAPSDDTLWVLATNIRIALEPCARQMSVALSEVPDPEVQTVLRELLYVAKRGSDFSDAHGSWLLRVSCEMAMRDRAEPSSALLAPAMRFGERVGCIVSSAKVYERVGAALASATFSSDACRIVGTLLRDNEEFADAASDRLPTLPAPRFTPYALADMLCPEAQHELALGTTRWANAAWLLMNDLYRACFVPPTSRRPVLFDA